MPRQVAVAVENNFRKGLFTEATGFNFPESACTETYNCEFNFDGSATRRLGFDLEHGYVTKNINRTNTAVSSYLWRNVAGDGNLTLVVVQVGPTIYFYKTTAASFSSGNVATTVTLSPVSGAPIPDAVEAQYSDGNGLLFITHPYCEPMYVSYDTSSDTASSTNITLQIRDFEGATADPYAVDLRPTASIGTVDVNHLYNLYNQGWNATNLGTWDTNLPTMPSNVDVMWRFKNSSNVFDTSVIANVIQGNSPAPTGHFILNLSNQNRDAAAGTTGVASTTTGSARPTTSAFFAGRLFYTGISKVGFNSKIYFTRIVQNKNQYSQCYETNDPTAEDLFDLLPDDGGVISIPEAGTIYKMFPIPGGMAIFASYGVWFLTGSTGIGFTATDYTIQKIANIQSISATSFVNVGGYPAWWNAEGIYTLSVEGNVTIPSVKSITYATINTFYADIPFNSKANARGYYNHLDGTIHWLFKSTDTTQVTDQYTYDRVLNFNVWTQAFFPWTITDTNVTVNGIVIFNAVSSTLTADNVINLASALVTDGSGNQVISFDLATDPSSALTVKYLVSYPDSGSYKFTFAETNNDAYLDWVSYDSVGIDYTSFFITGYKIRGEGLRKFQSTWIKILSRMSASVSYYFQGLWDYAVQGSDTGRWSSKQLVQHTDTKYSSAARRLKVRGNGIVLQYKVTSLTGQAFDIIGWVSMDTGNAAP